MAKKLFIAVALIALAVTSGCSVYGKGKAPVIVETNG